MRFSGDAGKREEDDMSPKTNRKKLE